MCQSSKIVDYPNVTISLKRVHKIISDQNMSDLITPNVSDLFLVQNVSHQKLLSAAFKTKDEDEERKQIILKP